MHACKTPSCGDTSLARVSEMNDKNQEFFKLSSKGLPTLDATRLGERIAELLGIDDKSVFEVHRLVDGSIRIKKNGEWEMAKRTNYENPYGYNSYDSDYDFWKEIINLYEGYPEYLAGPLPSKAKKSFLKFEKKIHKEKD